MTQTSSCVTHSLFSVHSTPPPLCGFLRICLRVSPWQRQVQQQPDYPPGSGLRANLVVTFHTVITCSTTGVACSPARRHTRRLLPNTHRRRRRDATAVELSRVGVGGLYRAYASIFFTAHAMSFWWIFGPGKGSPKRHQRCSCS